MAIIEDLEFTVGISDALHTISVVLSPWPVREYRWIIKESSIDQQIWKIMVRCEGLNLLLFHNI
jgi:hypothetical protein